MLDGDWSSDVCSSDLVKIEMLDGQGRSVFGAIEQRVERYTAP
jgi:hypothetical protein